MSIDKNSRAARQMNGQASRTPNRRSVGRRYGSSPDRSPSGSSNRRLTGKQNQRSFEGSGRRLSDAGGGRGRGPERRTGRRYKKRKRLAPWKIAVLAGLLLIVTSVSGAVYYVNHLLGKTTDLGVDMEEKTNPNLDIETKRVQKGFWKIAVFGLDSTDGNVGRGANSDVIIICSLNWETGEIKLASVYRDTFMKVGEKNPYRKINEAYARGGPDQAIEALNENLDIEVDDFVSVNWKVVADGINVLGGVDIEVTPAEFQQINGYITSVVENTGVYSQHLKAPGFQHLDGVQAVAYCRLRKMDTDFKRTERQRAVISQCLEKAKKSDIKVLNSLISLYFSQVATTVDMRDLMDLALVINRFHLGETVGFPFDLKLQDIGKLDCVVPVTLSSNVIKLHQFLFGTENYKPSEHVQRISEDIAYLSAKQADSGEKLNQEDIERMNSTTAGTRSTEEGTKKTEERPSRTSEESENRDENESEAEGREDPDNRPDESESESESEGSTDRTQSESSSGPDRTTSAENRDESHGSTAPDHPGTSANEGNHGTAPSAPGGNTGTSPGNSGGNHSNTPDGNANNGPGSNTSNGPGDVTAGPGSNTGHGPGSNTSQPAAPSNPASAGPGGSPSRGTVYTTRPIIESPDEGNEGGPGYEH